MRLGSGLNSFVNGLQHNISNNQKSIQNEIDDQQKEQERIQKAESRKVMREQNAAYNWQRYNEQRDDHYAIQELSDQMWQLQGYVNQLRQEVNELRAEIYGQQVQGPLNYTPGVM